MYVLVELKFASVGTSTLNVLLVESEVFAIYVVVVSYNA